MVKDAEPSGTRTTQLGFYFLCLFLGSKGFGLLTRRGAAALFLGSTLL